MKSVYTGGEKVGEFESYDELRVGDGKPAFIYEGSELVYPNPVKDGLVLWYDFSGRTNADGQRGIAEDLSGNGNHGTLQNFNFTAESGYDKNKLLFDGVDDYGQVETTLSTSCSYEVTFKHFENVTWGAPISSLGNLNPSEGFAITPRATGIVVSAGDGIGRYSHIYFYNGALPFDVITHLIVTYDGNVFSLYINGQYISDEAYNLKQSSLLLFGKWSPVVSGDYNFSGELYSTRNYNSALTPEEVAHNYAIEKERFGIE